MSTPVCLIPHWLREWIPMMSPLSTVLDPTLVEGVQCSFLWYLPLSTWSYTGIVPFDVCPSPRDPGRIKGVVTYVVYPSLPAHTLLEVVPSDVCPCLHDPTLVERAVLYDVYPCLPDPTLIEGVVPYDVHGHHVTTQHFYSNLQQNTYCTVHEDSVGLQSSVDQSGCYVVLCKCSA